MGRLRKLSVSFCCLLIIGCGGDESPEGADPTPTLELNWSEPLLMSTEGNEIASTENGGFDTLSVDGDRIHAVWTSGTPKKGSGVYHSYSDDVGQSWSDPVEISGAGKGVYKPVIDSEECKVYVAWRDLRDGDAGELYFNSSTDGGQSWQSEQRLTNNSDTTALSYLRAEGQAVFIAWEEYTPKCSIKFLRSPDGGKSWDGLVDVTDGKEVGSPSFVMTSDKTLHMTYGSTKGSEQTKGYNWEAYYRRSTDLGKTWGAEVRLTDDEIGDTRFPLLEADGDQLFHMLWWDDRDDTSIEHIGYPPKQPESDHNYEVYYKRSQDGGDSWEADRRLTKDDAISEGPSAAVKGGKVYVVWADERDGNFEIYVKYSTDAGDSWSEDIRMTNSVHASREPSITIDASGNVYVIWTEQHETKTSEVFLLKGTWQEPN